MHSFLLLALLAVSPDAPGVAVARVCATCHSNAPRATAMRDTVGRQIGPFDLWEASLMANAARDPIWRAALSVEVAANPSRRAEVEAKCLGCHAPLASRVGLDDHGTGGTAHALECDGQLGDLARDGVSCTICHGIAAQGLGTPTSFSGGFTLDEGRRLFGPHAAPFSMPMRHHTGFTPSQGRHVTQAALCGSCHTLETDALSPSGESVGVRFLEQAPYLEWRNSDWCDEGARPGPLATSCQGCHLPTRDADGGSITTRIARNPGGRDWPPVRPREPFGRHLLVGGNTLGLVLLREHAEELAVVASRTALEEKLAATEEQLRGRTAEVALERLERTDGGLALDVRVVNLTGHKLPTAHPTRRVWLRVVVRDADGRTLFASGTTDERGRILGPGGSPLPSEQAGGPVLPHRDVVREEHEVATFEGVLADVSGAPTHLLLRAAAWLKDDRLLPRGWSSDHPDADRTAPAGIDGDRDFAPGSDRVRYRLRVPAGATEVEVALLHQSLSARWEAELLTWDTPEVARLRRMLAGVDRRPQVLAAETRRVP